ncbi:hypothetical protein FGO68_gene3640 [Halteria grandinella]|uniref:Uncharacterized protein n=1 Tax=Halteria grandinella TaxID=5974 RepID=A0A8J8T3D0_HALGN|nr:hypothetical protein FGO68_gene3640 [Halteria grandinella]
MSTLAKQKGKPLLNRFEERVANGLRKIDIYGHPISLKYEKSATFQSPLGGFCTIIVLFIILYQFFYLFIQTVQRDKFTVVLTESREDLNINNSTYTLNQHNFDIAVIPLITGYLPNVTLDNIDDYFTVHIQNGYLKIVGTDPLLILEDQELERCGDDRFLNLTEKTKAMGIGRYLCPKKGFKFELQGSFSSLQNKFISVKINYCDQASLDKQHPGKGRKCKPMAQSKAILPFVQYRIAQLTQNFDPNEFKESPIKSQVNVDILVGLQESISNVQNYKLSRNTVILLDNWVTDLFESENEIIYTDMRYINGAQAQYSNSSIYGLAFITYALDDRTLKIERSVQTLSYIFSLLGGLTGAISLVIQALIGWLQEKLYISALIGQLFLYQPSAFGSRQKSEKLDSVQKEVLEIESFDSSISIANRQQDLPKCGEKGPGLVPFRFSIWEIIQYSLCFKYKDKGSKKLLRIYNQAKKTIQSHFQISNVIRTLRRVDDLTKLLLSKQQRKLVPMLKSNVLMPKLNKKLDLSSQSSDESSATQESKMGHSIKKHIQRRLIRNVMTHHDAN